MNKADIFRFLDGNLSDCFDERLRFNITDRAADFSDCHIRIGTLADIVDKAFDFIRDVRNDLHRFTEIFSSSFLAQNIPVCLAAGQI